jgi:lupus La protein
LFDGVKFTARRTGGEGGEVEIVDKATIGLGEGGWSVGKVMRFTMSKKDGSLTAPSESGEFFNFSSLKTTLAPIAKPAFVSLLPTRTIAAPPSTSTTSTYTMAVDTAPSTAQTLDAPPAIGSSAAIAVAVPVVAAPVTDSNNPQQYPADGQVSFREQVTEEILTKLRADIGVWEGRKVSWVRASGMFSHFFFLVLRSTCRND